MRSLKTVKLFTSLAQQPDDLFRPCLGLSINVRRLSIKVMWWTLCWHFDASPKIIIRRDRSIVFGRVKLLNNTRKSQSARVPCVWSCGKETKEREWNVNFKQKSKKIIGFAAPTIVIRAKVVKFKFRVSAVGVELSTAQQVISKRSKKLTYKTSD